MNDAHYPSAFVVNTRRDASASIAGFRYQIQLTLRRWLELAGDARLYCESGEDIDHVLNVLADERLLEQVKLRSKISLRHPAVIEAIARLFELKVANPNVQLTYRLLTTATAANEQRCVFPRKLPGLHLWMLARANRLEADEQAQFLDVTLTLLRAIKRPKTLKAELFDQLSRYLDDVLPLQFFQDYVCPIDWALCSVGPEQLESDLKDAVLKRLGESSHANVSAVLDALSAHLLRVLSRPGTKCLTVEDIQPFLTKYGLSATDERLLLRLNGLATGISDLQATADRTLGVVGAIDDKLAPMSAAFEALVQSATLHGLDVALPTTTEPAAIPQWAAPRSHIVERLNQQLAARRCCWLRAQPGGGKSTLARLVVESQARDSVWISLSDGAVRQDLAALVVLARRSGDPRALADAIGLTGQSLSEILARWLPASPQVIVVLDNMNSDEGTMLTLLVALLKHSASSGTSLIVTAVREAPPALLGQVSADDLWEYPVPPLETSEIEGILVSAIGGRPVSASVPGIVHRATSGHPVMVAAAVRFLMRSGWEGEATGVVERFSSASIQDVRIKTRQRLRHLVPDDGARRLLDRVSLLLNPIERREIDAVAAVEPAVPDAAEILLDLKDVWLQSLGSGRFQLSPLLTAVGREMLSASQQRAVHHASARAILQDRTLDPRQALKAITGLLGARAWRELSGFVIQLVQHVRTAEEARYFDLVPELLIDSWPSDMPAAARLAIRAAQIRIGSIAGGDTANLQRELLSLVDSFGADHKGESVIALSTAAIFNQAAPIEFALAAVWRITVHMRSVLNESLKEPLAPEGLFWLLLPRVRSTPDVLVWIGYVRRLDDDQLSRLFVEGERFGKESCEVLASACLSSAKRGDDSDGSQAMTALDSMSALATHAGSPRLKAAVAETRASLFSEHLGDPSRALEEVEAAYSSADAQGRVRLDHLAGCLLFDQGLHSDAESRFQAVLGGASEDDSFHCMDAARRLAEISGRRRDWTLTVERCRTAAVIARRLGFPFEALEMLGECAWAHWEAGNKVAMVTLLCWIERDLERHRDAEKDRYREVFRKVGHAAGWWRAIVLGEMPPPLEDGTPYTSPFVGFFGHSRPQLAEWPTPMSFSAMATLTAYAHRGTRGGALLPMLRFRRARRLAEAEGVVGTAGLTGGREAALAARAGRLKDGLVVGLRSSYMTALSAGEKSIAPRSSPVDLSVHVISKLPVEQRKRAERMVFWEVMCPAFADAIRARSAIEHCEQLLIELETSPFGSSTCEPEFWNALFKAGRQLCRLSIHDKRHFIAPLQAEQSELLMLSYMVLLADPAAALNEACSIHAVMLDAFFQRGTLCEESLDATARTVDSFWRSVAADRAYLLSVPRYLRSTLSEVQNVGPLGAAKIIFAAELSTGATLPSGLRRNIAAMAQREA